MKIVLSLVLALAGAVSLGSAAQAQCYPGLACPTDQTQTPTPMPAPTPMPTPVPQKIAPEPVPPQGAKTSEKTGGEYSFVGPVAPPDDWLSLRTLPTDKAGSRIMKMPAGTLFRVREKRDPWWFVELRDGTTGWAHSTWIRCCKSGNE